MTTADLVFLTVYVLATARITRLINRDTITDFIRIAAMKRRPGVAYFLSCPWCISVWIAAALGYVVWWRTGLDPVLIALTGAGASWITGMAAQLDREDIEISAEVDDAE